MPLDEAFVVMSGFKSAAKQRTDSDGNCRCRYCLVLQHLQKAKSPKSELSVILLTGSAARGIRGAVISEFFLEEGGT